jgi:hypothetical protein
MKQPSAELWTKWRGLISEQRQSGQTVKAFCEGRGLRDSLFYDWKSRIRDSDVEKFVEVRVMRAEERARSVPTLGSAIEVRLNKVRSLFVEPGFDPNHLRALLAVLETEA